MKIGELAEKAGVAPSAIRYYEQSGLLPKPGRGANGYREYADTALERLRQIQMAQGLGFSLDAIRSVFASHQELSKDQLLHKLDGRLHEIDQLMNTLREQRQHLQALRSTLHETWAAGECANVASLEHGRIAKSAQARRAEDNADN
ncbi:Mercuric resistance operon regulatory protein [Collimonas arenae]|uniref:Mercuric resistance operon regulatory protein n=1 Tax=Collimonas arenae TaxID=279058 RepID=A0A0A1F790_9BURK|nr:MerR family transcriptional regulator [Collimonas arenae]AIY40366.1 Mercuric resistance operon regulatory protein [Collimonas arenae]